MFQCVSAGVPPNKATFIDDQVVMLPQNVWDHLYSRYARPNSTFPGLTLSIFRSLISGCSRRCSIIYFVVYISSVQVNVKHAPCRYGGGPAVNHLYVCHTCQIEIEKLEKRRKSELDMFVRVSLFFFLPTKL